MYWMSLLKNTVLSVSRCPRSVHPATNGYHVFSWKLTAPNKGTCYALLKCLSFFPSCCCYFLPSFNFSFEQVSTLLSFNAPWLPLGLSVQGLTGIQSSAYYSDSNGAETKRLFAAGRIVPNYSIIRIEWHVEMLPFTLYRIEMRSFRCRVYSVAEQTQNRN